MRGRGGVSDACARRDAPSRMPTVYRVHVFDCIKDV